MSDPQTSYSINITLHPQYLHAVVTGNNTIQNVDRYLTDLQKATEHHCIANILIEEQLTGKGIDTFELFDVIRRQAKYARNHKLRIAYVDLNKEHHSTSVAFGENLANILGVNVKVFSSVDDARTWLTDIVTA
ncbi:MAG: hypothetical protein WCW40_01450 [Bacteroidota bacterium]